MIFFKMFFIAHRNINGADLIGLPMPGNGVNLNDWKKSDLCL